MKRKRKRRKGTRQFCVPSARVHECYDGKRVGFLLCFLLLFFQFLSPSFSLLFGIKPRDPVECSEFGGFGEHRHKTRVHLTRKHSKRRTLRLRCQLCHLCYVLCDTKNILSPSLSFMFFSISDVSLTVFCEQSQ